MTGTLQFKDKTFFFPLHSLKCSNILLIQVISRLPFKKLILDTGQLNRICFAIQEKECGETAFSKQYPLRKGVFNWFYRALDLFTVPQVQ